MSDFASLNPRQLHVAREHALDRMRHAWYAAAVSGTLGAAFFIVIAVDTGEWALMAPFLAGAFVTVALGYAVGHGHSQISALLLLLAFTVTVVGRIVETGRVSNLIALALFGYFYFQGLRGAIDYAEIRKQYERAPE